MGEQYIGEIKLFAGNFAPQDWSFCDGSTQQISDYETLFQLIGTTYGGDGQSTFNLPDLRGKVPIHQGTGTGGGGNYVPGQTGGTENVTLTTLQLPSHNHSLQATSGPGDTGTPKNGQSLASTGPTSSTSPPTYIPYDGQNQVALNGASIGVAGGNQPHSNVQPSLALNYIIALYGVYPSSS